MRRSGFRGAFASAVVALAAAAAQADEPKPEPKPPEPKQEGEPPAKRGRDADEAPLEGAAKEEHEKAVKEIVKRLRGERNRVKVSEEIERLGTSKGRAERDALIEFSRGNPNHEYVSYAFRALSKIGGTAVLEHLTGKDSLRSGDFMVQYYAAGALETMKDVRAVPALLTVLDGKLTKIEVQGACLGALGNCGSDARAREALFRYAAHKHDTVRASAFEALGRLKTDEAYRLLADRLFSDKNTRCREAAATGLGHCGRSEAIPLLQQAAQSDEALTVRQSAANAMKRLGGR